MNRRTAGRGLFAAIAGCFLVPCRLGWGQGGNAARPTRPEPPRLRTWEQQSRIETWACLSPDGSQLATFGAYDGMLWIRLWDPIKLIQRGILTDFLGALPLRDFSPDGEKLLTLDYERFVTPPTPAAAFHKVPDVPVGRRLRLWETKTCKLLWNIPLADQPGATRFTANGAQIVQLDQNRILHRWEAGMGQEVSQADMYKLESKEGSLSWPAIVAFSADATRVATVNKPIYGEDWRKHHDGYVRAWDVTEKRLRVFRGRTRDLTETGELVGIAHLALTHDGRRYITLRQDHLLTVWDFDTGAVLHEFQPESRAYPHRLACNADASRIVTACDGMIHVWDGRAGRPVRAIEFPRDSLVKACAFLPNDRIRLVTQGVFRELERGIFEASRRNLKAERRGDGIGAFYGAPMKVWDVDLAEPKASG